MDTGMQPRRTLNHIWTFFLDEIHLHTADRKSTLLGEVSTAREFWNYFELHNVKNLKLNERLSIALKGIKLHSASDVLVEGGQLWIQRPHGQSSEQNLKDDYKLWLETTMAVVAEQLQMMSTVYGISFDRREPSNAIILWIDTCSLVTVESLRDDLTAIVSRLENYVFTFHRVSEAFSPKIEPSPSKFRRTNSAPDIDNLEKSVASLEASLNSSMENCHQPSPTTLYSPTFPPSETDSPSVSGDAPTRRKKAPPALDPNKVPTAEQHTRPVTTTAPKSRRKLRSRSQGQAKDFFQMPHPHHRRSALWPLGLKSLPVTPANLSPDLSTIGPRKKTQQRSQAATPVAEFKVIAPSPFSGAWADAPWTPSFLANGQPNLTPVIRGHVVTVQNYIPSPVPCGFSELAKQHQQESKPAQQHLTVPPTGVLVPLSSTSIATTNVPIQPTQPVAQTGKAIKSTTMNSTNTTATTTTTTTTTTTKRSTPPPASLTNVTTTASPPPPVLHQAGKDTPPPPASSSKVSNTALNALDDKGDGSVAGAFVCYGWYFPPKLNRKTRRRIQFAPEFVPTEIPGALYVGMDVPDESLTPEREAVILRIQPDSLSLENYLLKRNEIIGEKLKDKPPFEVKSSSPNRRGGRGGGGRGSPNTRMSPNTNRSSPNQYGGSPNRNVYGPSPTRGGRRTQGSPRYGEDNYGGYHGQTSPVPFQNVPSPNRSGGYK
eukprot:PhF_6_TR12597/c0_g1_i2/m.19855